MRSGIWITQLLSCKYTIPAFHFVNIRQTAPPRLVVATVWLYSLLVNWPRWRNVEDLEVAQRRRQTDGPISKDRKSWDQVRDASWSARSLRRLRWPSRRRTAVGSSAERAASLRAPTRQLSVGWTPGVPALPAASNRANPVDRKYGKMANKLSR